MPSLKDIKLRITSVKNTQKTTRAMKMVSASKLRRAQDRAMKLRPYADRLSGVLRRVIAGLEGSDFRSVYADQRPVQNVLIVLVTSNKGLAGAFNLSIIRLALAHVEANYPEQLKAGMVSFLCIGKKGYDYLRTRGYKLVGENHDVFANLTAENVNAVTEKILLEFAAEHYDRVDIAYNEFKSVISQTRQVEQFLPIPLPQETAKPVDYIFEPEREDILNSIIPLMLKMRMYRAVLESNSSEHGARMFAMDNATENAQDLLGSLRLSYNKARQAAITKELIEIVSGAEALAAG